MGQIGYAQRELHGSFLLSSLFTCILIFLPHEGIGGSFVFNDGCVYCGMADATLIFSVNGD